MKKIFALLVYLFCGYFVQAQDLDQTFDQYEYQSRYLNSVQVWSGRGLIPLPSKIFLNPRLLDSAKQFPKVIIVNGIKDIKALQRPEIRERLTGLIVTVKDSSEFISTIREIVNFPNLQYLHLGAEPGVVDNSHVDERANRYRLPDNINQLRKLEIVAFTGGFADLDDAVQKLSGLKSLKALSFNQVYKPIPTKLISLKQIRLINMMGDNNLQELDLTHLKWESVRLWRTPDSILHNLARIPSLKSLELRYPRILSTDVLLKFKHLKRLSLSGSGFKDSGLLKKISLMKDLNWLKLAHLNDLDLTGISKIKSLKYLELINFHSPLKHAEALSEIAELTHLEVLKLGSCRLSRVPDIFAGLKSLKLLTLEAGEQDLPTSIFQLPELDSLILSGSGIKSLPELPVYGFQKLKVLRINSTGLRTLPKALLGLPQLLILDLSKNQLSDVPAEGWDQLKKLNSLSLDHNQLDRLPLGLGQLTALQFMNAANNRLQELPASIGNCTELKRLILDNNNIVSLPEGLKAANSLEILKLSNNPGMDGASVWKVILAVPRTGLFVDVSKTGLKKLPESGNWKDMKFTKLILEDNSLRTLPASFSQIQDFSRISLKGNPLQMPQQLADVRILSRADLKIVFDELKVPMAGEPVPNEDYALVLLDRISYLNRAKDWERVVAFANEALKIAPAVYHKSWYASLIGIARFKTNDYKGAIADLERFVVLDHDSRYRSATVYANVELCLYDAYMALGEKDRALNVKTLFEETRDEVESFYTFLDHYLDTKDRENMRVLMERALPAYEQGLFKERQPNGNPVASFLCEYAEVLIMAEKPQKAAKLLRSMTDENYRKPYLSIKNCLLAMAAYLSKEKPYEQVRTELVNAIAADKKIPGNFWDFETLNHWSDFRVKSDVERGNLKSLQAIATGNTEQL